HLKMQSAQDASCGAGMIVLYEIIGDAGVAIALALKALVEESALIRKGLRRDHQEPGNARGLDPHGVAPPVSAASVPALVAAVSPCGSGTRSGARWNRNAVKASLVRTASIAANSPAKVST